jgi:hypothetical protein
LFCRRVIAAQAGRDLLGAELLIEHARLASLNCPTPGL